MSCVDIIWLNSLLAPIASAIHEIENETGKVMRANKGWSIDRTFIEFGSTMLEIINEVSAPNHKSKCILTDSGKDHAKNTLQDIAAKNPA
tara:strand:+ start:193 stop:462 length:270 start_codon:yes stop_codon:yes gene_type:complete